MRSIAELEAAYEQAVSRYERLSKRDDSDWEDPAFCIEFDDAKNAADRLSRELDEAKAIFRAKAKFNKTDSDLRTVPAADGRGIVPIKVTEADMYTKRGRSFFADMYAAKQGDLVAQDRLFRHQENELEKRSMSTGTFGGLIPPAYLLELYAKAGRSGRHFVDSINRQELPEYGMSIIIPRLTTGTTAGIQASENSAVSTQDAVEVDLTVPVRTIAGYVPVSRQSIERAEYNEEILMEDLIARNWATYESQAVNGSGASGQHLGLNQTSGVEAVALNSWSVPNLWGALADSVQRIATNVGGLGYEADTVCMHPRRWAAIASSLDAQDRPLLLPNGAPMFNTLGAGEAAKYGFVGSLFGLKVVTSTGIPTNQGAGTNQDLIFVYASQAHHSFERSEDPVTLAFEQQAGTNLTVQLVAYSYSAVTFGRYPGAAAVVSGAGLTPPIYGERAS